MYFFKQKTAYEIELDEESTAHETEQPEPEGEEAREGEDEEISTQHCYRTQRRGGKGLRDVKTTQRNGPAIGIVSVRDEDELFMITARGKIQRISAADISIIGRNTQGVRIMSLDR